MVPGSRTEGNTGTHMLSAKVRKTIQSIREIVGNHSDADIYVALKESNMDPNETTQKLLNQDPFHEVKRRRDRKKETQDFGNKGLVESRRQSENGGQRLQFHTPSERNGQRTNYSRNPLPRVSREFRVVRDNRVNHIDKEVKPSSLQDSTSTAEQTVVNTHEKKGSSAAYTNQRLLNGPSDSHGRQSTDAVSNVIDRKIANKDEKQGTIALVQPIKPNNIHQNSSTNASTSSAMGVYSSSTDPVHVPSPDSRSPGVVGAIRREVGVVGVRRLSSDNKAKQLFVSSSSHAISLVGKDGPSADSAGTISMPEQYSQTTVTEPSFSGMSASRPSLNNVYNSRPHQQLAGHQRVSQHNKEWKPKSSQKANRSPGVIGTPKKTVSPPAQDSENVESEAAKLTDNLSKVTIAEHICVAETDRLRLTFGTLGVGAKLEFLGHQSKYHIDGATEKSSGELTTSVVPAPELSSDDVSGSTQVDMLDDEHIRNLVSDSPASGAASEQQLPDHKESSSPQNLNNYANIGLERDTSRPYVPSESQQQDSHDMPGFSAYDPPNGYDIPYFRPTIDETARGRILSPPHEGLSSHAGNSISMVQQQQPPVAQMYPQVHVSHYANLMPYRQYLSPVYVPPMAVQGYSNNSPYPHPTNGNSYLLMPGGSSHLNANNLKYGVQQFKPVPAGSPTGFGNFGNPTGYAMLAPGVVGGATALEDSSRVKYKDNLYVPNPQGETSEIWLQNPRDLSGMQSSPYYNMPPGQSPHAAAFMPSQHGHHHGHASFNAAAAAQSSHNHMQFPPAGMYHTHTPPQQAPHHHLANNGVGVGVAAASPGPQVGAYQQPQLGHLNWTTSF